MVGPLEFSVVKRPFSWHAVSSMLISVPELTQLFVSCGDIRTVWRFGASKQSLFHRNLGEGRGWLGAGGSERVKPVRGTSIVCDTSA